MLKLYFAPRTRSVRIAWLLEELALPYELAHVTFRPPARTFFNQDTPTGKLPTLVDGDVVLAESGAIVEYVLETYADGALAPAPRTPERPAYLQWLHFAESTAFPPLGILVWLTVYRDDAASHPDLIEDAVSRARQGLVHLEHELGAGPYLLGERFSAADVMMGFTLVAAAQLKVLDASLPVLSAYVERLLARPALARVLAVS
jgi:glutathione S-transferase